MRLIAEMGCNHQGDLKIAKDMITKASPFVWACKFQKRDPATFARLDWPHPDPANAFGNPYGEHRRVLELTIAEHDQLKIHCDEQGVEYGCSVWDYESANEIIDLIPTFIKIPSARNTDWEVCEIVRDDFDGEIMVSLGLTDREDIEQIEEFWDGKDVTFLVCTSSYPCKWEDITLGDIQDYVASGFRCGLSGHHTGIAPDVCAVALGADVVERHFTLDKEFKGTDHSFSIEPRELMMYSSYLGEIDSMMHRRKEVFQSEMPFGGKL